MTDSFGWHFGVPVLWFFHTLSNLFPVNESFKLSLSGSNISAHQNYHDVSLQVSRSSDKFVEGSIRLQIARIEHDSHV